jgi:signal transduction histidine kinase
VFSFRRVYRFIRSVSLGADQIMRGSYETSFGEAREGELSILGLQFNQMSKRLQLSFTQLHIEQERLRNLIPDISHQLKTPLSSLSMHNEILLTGDLSSTEIQGFLEKNRILIERMEWLTHSLLSLSRLESGAIQMQMISQDLRDILYKCVSSLDNPAVAKKQSISLNLPEYPVHVQYDRHWLQEAVDNIVQNAIHYTAAKGSITLRLTESELLATLTIQDTGIGISQEDLPYIFDRFFRGGTTLNRTGTGSGIGLSLTKLIIDRHGGQIEVSSVLGQGSSFIVILPK